MKKIIAAEQTVALYESCHRIIKLLQELTEHGGGGLRLVVCRELTKMFESVYRGMPAEVLAELQKDKNNLKGEFVVVIGS